MTAKKASSSLVGDDEGLKLAALVVELRCRARDFFEDEGVARDGGSFSVHSSVVAGREFPYDGQGRGLGGADDDLSDGLVLF